MLSKNSLIYRRISLCALLCGRLFVSNARKALLNNNAEPPFGIFKGKV